MVSFQPVGVTGFTYHLARPRQFLCAQYGAPDPEFAVLEPTGVQSVIERESQMMLKRKSVRLFDHGQNGGKRDG
jgi:hypothetical protein